MSATIAMAQTYAATQDMGQAALTGALSFGASAASFGMGSAMGQAATKVAQALQSVAIGSVTSMASSVTRAAITSDFDMNRSDWDTLMIDWAAGVGASAAGAIAGAAASAGIGGGETGNSEKQYSAPDPNSPIPQGKGHGTGDHWVKGPDGQYLGGGPWEVTYDPNDPVSYNQRLQQSLYDVQAAQTGQNEGGGEIVSVLDGPQKGDYVIEVPNKSNVGRAYILGDSVEPENSILGNWKETKLRVRGDFHTHPSGSSMDDYPSFKEWQHPADTAQQMGRSRSYVVTENHIWRITHRPRGTVVDLLHCKQRQQTTDW